MHAQKINLIDHLIIQVDNCLKAIASEQPAHRPYPAKNLTEATLTQKERTQCAGFMRVNHSGEVCAQALYNAQALVAHTSDIKTTLLKCGREETDHLAWCNERLIELNSHRSLLNFFWYWNSFMIGIAAGLAGDKWSLGFVEETEVQVSKHLQNHLNKLPKKDNKTKAVITQMQQDEELHAHTAKQKGATSLPKFIKKLMVLHAKVMTTLSYRI